MKKLKDMYEDIELNTIMQLNIGLSIEYLDFYLVGTLKIKITYETINKRRKNRTIFIWK